MRWVCHSHRFAEDLLESRKTKEWGELKSVLRSITDDEVKAQHEAYLKAPKSASVAINAILRTRLTARGWDSQSEIFQDAGYTKDIWKLDFAKGEISVEVAFNNQGSVAWNLLKPCLASELNHLKKRIQTKFGVIITATNEFKTEGGFDGAVGSFETYVRYLKPLGDLLQPPILIIGLKPLRKFRMKHQVIDKKKRGTFILR